MKAVLLYSILCFFIIAMPSNVLAYGDVDESEYMEPEDLENYKRWEDFKFSKSEALMMKIGVVLCVLAVFVAFRFFNGDKSVLWGSIGVLVFLFMRPLLAAIWSMAIITAIVGFVSIYLFGLYQSRKKALGETKNDDNSQLQVNDTHNENLSLHTECIIAKEKPRKVNQPAVQFIDFESYKHLPEVEEQEVTDLTYFDCIEIAKSSFYTGNFFHGLDHCQEALKFNGNNPEPYLIMGSLYRALNRLPEAQANWRKAESLAMENKRWAEVGNQAREYLRRFV